MSAPEDLKDLYIDELKDLWSAYQRMTHYGIAGFGTAGAYAKALGLKEDVASLKLAVKEMYGSDEYMSKLADGLSKIPSKSE